MKKKAMFIIALLLTVTFALVALAQEQQKGKPLVFPKEMVEEDRPSDLHMGSDPYYEQDKDKYEGSDEEGYPSEYDPQMQYYESTTEIKKIDKKKKSTD
jgi:hypothetical protein